MTASYDAIRMLKDVARDMGISTRKLARETLSARAMADTPKPKLALDQNDARAVSRNSDRVAEQFGTFASDRENAEWATVMRDAMRNDRAAIMARKIARAIPATKDAIVTTKLGYDVVTISRVERAANMATIRRQLDKAIQLESDAMNRRHNVEAIEAAKTNLNRAPKAAVAASKRASAVADREHARVRKLRRKMARAASQRVANNLTVARVGDVRLSLRPQSMANQVARLVMDIPDRKDTHPFREFPRVRAVTATSAIPTKWNPEAEYIRYLDLLELENTRAIARARHEAEKQAFMDQIEAMLNAERDAARAIKQANTRAEYNARRALAAKVRRANSKKYGEIKRMK